MNLLEVKALTKIYPGKIPTHALTNINLSVESGEFVGIMGPLGSGKTTLLNMISTIDQPSSGEVKINGRNPYTMSKQELAHFRRRELGFIFQDLKLMETLTVAENIVLPLTLDNREPKGMESSLQRIAGQFNITDILNKRIYELSGGQRQRTALARAIINSPALILADEPTGSLDSISSPITMELLANINRTQGTTLILVTHDPQAASYCNRIIFIKDGKLAAEIHRGTNRQSFYQQIMDNLSSWGGNNDELSSIRV